MMTQDYARTFWDRLLTELSLPADARIQQNPAIAFTKNAKAGAYDRLTDEEYEEALENVEQESALFQNKRIASSFCILQTALTGLSFEEGERDSLLDLLAKITSHTDFRPKASESNQKNEKKGQKL